MKAKDYDVVAVQVQHLTKNGIGVTWWWLRIGGSWTVPAVEIQRSDGNPCDRAAIVVADAGRASTAARTESLLDRGYRVLTVDPFYIGESKISQLDFLFALLVATVGDRSVGLQSSQLAAVARWFTSRHGETSVELISIGPRLSLASLIAAALEPHAIGDVELHHPLTSLHQVIEENMSLREAPELFCFGLLKHFDIPQIAELVSPRKVEIVNPPFPPAESN